MILSDENVVEMVDKLRSNFSYIKLQDRISPAVLNYVPGDWFKARTIDEMQAFYQLARKAPAFRPGMDSAESAGLHCSG